MPTSLLLLLLLIVLLQGDPTYLIVNSEGAIENYGLNAVCTHLGCVVPWVGVSTSLSRGGAGGGGAFAGRERPHSCCWYRSRTWSSHSRSSRPLTAAAAGVQARSRSGARSSQRLQHVQLLQQPGETADQRQLCRAVVLWCCQPSREFLVSVHHSSKHTMAWWPSAAAAAAWQQHVGAQPCGSAAAARADSHREGSGCTE